MRFRAVRGIIWFMRSYMLTLILAPDTDVTDTKGVDALVKKFVGELGTVKDVTVMGKKKLTYPMKKQLEGVFVNATLEASGLKISHLGKQANTTNEVLRYMLTVVGNKG